MSLLNDMLKDLNKNKQSAKSTPLLASIENHPVLSFLPDVSPWLIVPFACCALFLLLIFFYDASQAPQNTALTSSSIAETEQSPAGASMAASVVPPVPAVQSLASALDSSPPLEEPVLKSELPVIATRNIGIEAEADQYRVGPNLVTNDESQVNKVFVALTDTEWHDEQLNLALTAIQENQDEHAEQILSRILTRFPRAIVARETLANLYLAQERIDSARQTIEEGLKFLPHAITLNMVKARLLVEEKHPKEALAILKQFSPGIRKNPDFYGLMAAILQTLGQQKEAGALYKVLVQVEPSNGQYWLGYGIALEQSKENKQAVTAYKAVTDRYDIEPAIRAYAENRLKTLQG